MENTELPRHSTVDVGVSLAALSEKDAIVNMMQLYLYDISEFSNAQLNENGEFNSKNMEHYWMFSNRYPYLITLAGQLAGFALLTEPSQQVYELTELFVTKALRKQGVGRCAATKLFRLFPGAWHITQDNSNVLGQMFLRNTIKEFTNGEYEETILKDSPKRLNMYFSVNN